MSKFVSLLIYGFNEIVSKLAPFVTSLFIASLVDPSSFGELAIYLVGYEISVIFISNNIQASTRVHFFKLNKRAFIDFLSRQMVISVLAVLLISAVVCVFLNVHGLVWSMILVSSLLRTVSLSHLSYFQCAQQPHRYALSNITYALVLALVSAVLIHQTKDVGYWALALLSASIIQLVISSYYFRLRSYKIFNHKSILRWKFTCYSGLMFMPQALGWWIKSGLDRLVIDNYLGKQILGIYSLSLQITFVFIVVVNVLNLMVVPIINLALKQRDHVKVLKLLQGLTLLLSVCVVIATPIIYFLIGLLYGEQYSAAPVYFLFLVPSVFFQGLFMFYATVLYYCGLGGFVAKNVFFAFLIHGIVVYLLVPYFGLLVVFVAHTATALYLVVATVLSVKGLIFESQKITKI